MLYTIVVFAMMSAVPYLVEVRSKQVFAEHHLVEWIQFATLAMVTLILAIGAWRIGQYRELLMVLASWTCFAMIREKDAFLDDLLPHIGWKLAIVIPSIVFLYVMTRWGIYKSQLRRFLFTPAFVLFWAGFIIAVPIAQMIGNSDLLIDLMGADYQPNYKRFIEEVGEAVGYAILLMAAIECLLNLRSPIGISDLPEL